MAGRATIVAVRRLGARDPELPAATDDVGDPGLRLTSLVAGLIGGALRASAHGISPLTVQHTGRRPSAVEYLINASSGELIGLLLGP